MADSLAERDKLLSEVLQQVSSQTAGVITDALAGQRSGSSSSKSSGKFCLLINIQHEVKRYGEMQPKIPYESNSQVMKDPLESLQ